MSVIWSKFFWQDWANDPALRLCSLGAQGLWMRMLCVAAEANPIGYVAVNGQALGVTDISRLAGVTETEASALIGELDRYGVFSRTRTGVIYSRRMIRDAKKRVVASENGKKGGAASLGKDKGNSGLLKQNSSNGLSHGLGPISQEPEAREEILSPSFHSGESGARPPEKPPRKLKSSTPNRTRIDPEAVDGPAEYAEFEKSGLPMADLERVWLNFRDHHASKGSLMADWLAAWRTWLRREIEFRSRNAGSAPSFPFGKPEKRVLQ